MEYLLLKMQSLMFWKKILLIECPKFLFPFLRSIIASSTREGGFPPLMLNPVDFVGMYESKKSGGKKNNYSLIFFLALFFTAKFSLPISSLISNVVRPFFHFSINFFIFLSL